MEQRRSDILSAAAHVQDGAGVVILTDMFGGTPSNLAISVMDGGRIEVICGINLPMLIKLATMRETADLDHAVIGGTGSGPQIHHHRQQGSGREMSDADDSEEDCPPPPEFEGALSRELKIVNRKGLHARATAKFVQCVDRFDADIKVTRCGEIVGGDSIMGILTLGAGIGSTITVSRFGAQAERRSRRIAALVANRFGEDE